MIRALSRLWHRFRSGPPVVVVSGLPRSGTSMVMQMLEAGGVEVLTDRRRVPDESNPRGYFEVERVKALEAGDVAWVAEARGKAVKVIGYLLEHLPRNFHYQVIFIIRNLEEVLASQDKMLALLGEPDSPNVVPMREIFYGQLARARRLLATDPRFEVLYLRHDEVLRNPEAAARRIAMHIGGKLDVGAMAAAVDPDLHRTRIEK